MKKYLLILFLISCICTTESMAQIQRKFWGMELSISTRQECIDLLTQKGFTISNSREDRIIAEGSIRFGGYDWESMMILFSKEKCSAVYFVNLVTSINEKACDFIWEGLCEKLKRKYSSSFIKEDTEKNILFFTDSNTGLITNYSMGIANKVLSLNYYDINLSNTQSQSDDDEL